jgi:hypothetical protein
MGVLSLAKKYGCSACDDACAAALELRVPEYRFVRRYLERSPQAPLSLRQVDPLIRELTQYRDRRRPSPWPAHRHTKQRQTPVLN